MNKQMASKWNNIIVNTESFIGLDEEENQT